MSVNKQRAWDNLTKLSFERVTGTSAEVKAAGMILEECEKAGVEAHLEEYEIEMPVITKASFVVEEPEYKEYHVIGIGKSAITPEEGIEAGFVYVENGMDANLVDVKGKVVLVQGRTAPDFYEKLAKRGAVAYMTMHGDFYDDPSLIPELRPRNAWGSTEGLPGLVVHIGDAERIVRSHPTKVKIVLQGDYERKGTSHNVVATIEGSEIKDEIIAFSAHYDSVPYSPGAWDNMTGSITIMELMHHFKENPPKRTCKFIWCGSEEIGLVGSRKYCEMHKDELKDYMFNINFDMTGVTLGYEHCRVAASKEVEDGIKFLAKSVGYPVETKQGMYSSDSSSFASAGVPACTFARLQPRGGAVIHDHRDTMDHLDPDAFMITLNFVVQYGDLLANAPVRMIPRDFGPEMTKQLEEHKKFMEKMMKKKEEKK